MYVVCSHVYTCSLTPFTAEHSLALGFLFLDLCFPFETVLEETFGVGGALITSCIYSYHCLFVLPGLVAGEALCECGCGDVSPHPLPLCHLPLPGCVLHHCTTCGRDTGQPHQEGKT